MIRILRFLASHPLTRSNMVPAILRVLKYQILTRAGLEVTWPWIEGTKLVSRIHTPGASGNIYTGLHEYPDMGFLIHFLREEDHFVDIGANVGSWTVLASGLCKARTTAFEPDPETARQLGRNIAANGIEKRVAVMNFALGRSDGTTAFTVGRGPENRIALPRDDAVQEVPVRRLDGLLSEAPTFIKADVEGFEEDVFEGAGDLLSSPRLQAVSTELCSPAIERLLGQSGLTRMWYDPGSRTLSPEPNGLASNNSLFVRDLEKITERVSSAPVRTIFGQSL
jgi:FkbM family methyltransferase